MEKLDVTMLKPILGLNESIDKIMESCSLKPGVSDICKKYKDALQTTDEVALFESFVSEIRPFNGLEVVNNQIQKIERIAEAEKINISILKNLNALSGEGNIGKVFESEVVDYLVNKSNPTMSALRGKLEVFKGDPHVDSILESVTTDEYTQRIAGRTSKLEVTESAKPTAEVLYTKEQLDKIVKDKVDEAVAEAKKDVEPQAKYVSDLGSFIKLEESIDRVYAIGSHNEGLKKLCEHYKNLLNKGYSELALYESVISGMNDYAYINGVDTEMSALNARIGKYKQEIDLMKIVETMKETTSYWIVPLIEEAVAKYMQNKNQTSRFMLRNACHPFMHDDYVKNIIRVVERDDSISTLFHGSVLESAGMDNLSIKKIFSPVLYIKESECIFNVGGVYYDRKGQTISKVPKATVEHLDEAFKAACNVLNSGRVSYDETADGFVISSATNASKATINESGLSINGTPTDISSLNENLIAFERYSGNGQFYDDIKAIYESYDIITEVPFVKRVILNESDKSVDLFKIKNSICLALNESDSSRFFRNVNPLQCKNYINEHMNINASMMFESLMPDQKVIESEIADSKKAYEAYIEELKAKKKELQSLKESGESEDDDAINKAIDLIDAELDDIVGDYKEYQKKADDFTGSNGAEGEDKKDDKEGGDKDKSASDDVKNDVVDPLGNEAEKNGEATVNPDDINNSGDNVDASSDRSDSSNSTGDDIPNLSGQVDASYDEFDGILNTPKSDGNFEVVKVSFDKNVKNGKTSGKGSVIVMTPTVNSNGDVKDEITTLTFTLDPSTKKPIVNNDHMPLAMYNAIVDAIAASPEIDTIELGSDTSSELSVPSEGGEASVVADPLNLPSETSSTQDSSVVTGDPLQIPSDTSSVSAPLDLPQGQSDVTTGLTDTHVNPDELGTHITPEGGEGSPVTLDNEGDNKESEEELYRKEDESYISVANAQGPVEVGLFAEDVHPLSLADFAEELEQKGLVYKMATDKETGKDAVVITCETRADVIALRKFFERIFNTTREKFFQGFPELRCFESFAYKKADKIYGKLYESVSDDEEEGIEFDLPYSPELADRLKEDKYITKEYVDELTPESDKITVELKNDGDINKLCDDLWDFVRDLEVSEYRTDLIDAVSEISTTTIPVELPMVEGLLNDLDKKGLVYDYTDGNEESVYVFISSEEEKADIFNICDKLGIDLTDEGPLAELDKWTEDLDDDKVDDGSVNEGLKITVEDTENHKKVTFDTDDLDANKDETDKSEEQKDGDSGFGNDTELFNSREEAQQASDNNGSGDKGNDNGQNESQDDVKKKVKFRFRPNKKMNESAVAALGAGDTVKYRGRTGKITEKRPDGVFIVLIQGETIPCKESDLVPVTIKRDDVDYPHQFDKTTLKNLNAQ